MEDDFQAYVEEKKVGACQLETHYNYLSEDVRAQLEQLQLELNNEEITPKGFKKKKDDILKKFEAKLPAEARAELTQLDLELSEKEITVLGYEKKKKKIIETFVNNSNVNILTNTTGAKAFDVKKDAKSTDFREANVNLADTSGTGDKTGLIEANETTVDTRKCLSL